MIKVGDSSPWGPVQEVLRFGLPPNDSGVAFVSTASHGGFWVSPDACRRMPPSFRAIVPFTERGVSRGEGSGRWYEEDCDYCLVVLAFPELFTREQVRGAIGCGLRWHGDTVKAWLDNLPNYHPVCVARLGPAMVEVGA